MFVLFVVTICVTHDSCLCFSFNEPATTEIYTYLHTLSLHDALPILSVHAECRALARCIEARVRHLKRAVSRHAQSLEMSLAVADSSTPLDTIAARSLGGNGGAILQSLDTRSLRPSSRGERRERGVLIPSESSACRA